MLRSVYDLFYWAVIVSRDTILAISISGLIIIVGVIIINLIGVLP